MNSLPKPVENFINWFDDHNHSRRYGVMGTLYAYFMAFTLIFLAFLFVFDMVTGSTPKSRYEFLHGKEK